MIKRTDATRFAEATDELIAHGRASAADGLDADLGMAVRLYATADPLPDPAFTASLRAALLARVRQAPPAGATAHPAPDDAGAVRTAHAAEVHYAPLETPIGRIFVAYRDGRVVSTSAAVRDAAAFERNVALELRVQPIADQQMPAPLRDALLAHLAGTKRFEDVDLSRLRPFQRRVLEKTAEIPRGEVRPYGWIAKEIGSPGATRAVGTALGHNPIPFIIPCHRVVRADGSLGEYSGGGPEMKVRVLTFEGVPAEVLDRAATA